MADAATARPRRAAATRRDWEHTVKPAVIAQLTLMATTTKNGLTINAGPAGANVLSTITGGAAVANGAYNSSTGVHAEIDAITTLGAANWNQALTITTNKEPCPRCAVILQAFVGAHNWTVRAPANTFASNYVGAYLLPDNILTLVIQQLAPALAGDEGTYFRTQIKEVIVGFAVQ